MYEVKPPSLRVWPTAFISHDRQCTGFTKGEVNAGLMVLLLLEPSLELGWYSSTSGILALTWRWRLRVPKTYGSWVGVATMGYNIPIQRWSSESEQEREREKGTLVLTNCDNGNGKSVQEGHYDSHLRGLALSKSTQDDIFSRHDVSEAWVGHMVHWVSNHADIEYTNRICQSRFSMPWGLQTTAIPVQTNKSTMTEQVVRLCFCYSDSLVW